MKKWQKIGISASKKIVAENLSTIIFIQTIASACIIKSAEWGAETDFGLKQPNWQLATILFWHFFWH